MTDRPPPPEELEPLIRFSARIGRDSTHVQAAGGNTSLKTGDTMWVKASGTWLAEADRADIMVPMSVRAVRAAMDKPGCTEADMLACIDKSLGNSRLRPSVEAPVHAVLPGKYVVHTHDVEVLAAAVQRGSEAFFDAALRGMPWRYVPYIKPGIPLGLRLRAIQRPTDRIFILENHGLVVCGDDLSEIETVIEETRARIRDARPSGGPTPRTKGSTGELDLTDTGFCQIGCDRIDEIAFDKTWQRAVNAGSIAPDFLVFLGPSLPVLDRDSPTLKTDLARLAEAPLPWNACVILDRHGMVIRKDALRGTREILACLRDVLDRISEGAELRFLGPHQVLDLLNWDAETYRQNMNQTKGPAP